MIERPSLRGWFVCVHIDHRSHITWVCRRNAHFCSHPELPGLVSKAHVGIFSDSPGSFECAKSKCTKYSHGPWCCTSELSAMFHVISEDSRLQ